MTTAPSIDVVILSWNDGDLLETALRSALASEGVDVRCTVVDNGSEPPVALDDPRVTVVRNDDNRGVAPGRAQGIEVGDAPLVCLLDSDARLHPETLLRMSTTLATDPEIALVAPVFDDQEPDDSAGLAPSLGDKVRRGLSGSSSYRAGTAFDDAGLRDVDFAIGACQLFRRDAHDVIGGLDVSIFYGPEDVDFCLRLRRAGWRIVQDRHAPCFHPPRRSNRALLTRRGLDHAMAVGKHLWKHRDFSGSLPEATPVRYEIPGVATFSVDPRVSGAGIIEEILGHHRTEPSDAPADIVLLPSVEQAARRAGARLVEARNGPGFTYGDGWFLIADGTTLVARAETGLVIGSTRNVDRSILTVLDWICAPRGTALVHAAAVAVDGKAALISGWGGVGKTATLAKLCRRGAAEFIADDMLPVGADGTAHALPKPMFIYPYHEAVFPELFASDHKRLVPVSLTPATEVARTAVRPLFTASPALENWARKVTPEHMKTPPARAIPGLEIADATPVRLVLRLERSPGARGHRGEMPVDELVDGLVNEFFGEATAGTGLHLPLAATSAGIYPLHTWLADRAEALGAAVEGCELLRIQLPDHVLSEETSTMVSETILDLLGSR